MVDPTLIDFPLQMQYKTEEGCILVRFLCQMGSGPRPITWRSEAAVDPFELIPFALEPSATRLSPDMPGKYHEKKQLHASVTRP